MSAVDDNICGAEVSFSTGRFLTRQVWTARCTKTWGHELKPTIIEQRHTAVMLLGNFYAAVRWFTSTHGVPSGLTVNGEDEEVVQS